MIPALMLIGGTLGLAWLRWGRAHRCRPCGAEFTSARALARHQKGAHRE